MGPAREPFDTHWAQARRGLNEDSLRARGSVAAKACHCAHDGNDESTCCCVVSRVAALVQPYWWWRSRDPRFGMARPRVSSWWEIGEMITIELSKQGRAEAIASIQKYFEEEIREPLGELRAGLVLDFFVEEIGPAIYNKAIGDAQARMQQRVADLDGELYADEFQYWPRVAAKRKGKK